MLAETQMIDVRDLPSHLTGSNVPPESELPGMSSALDDQERRLVVRALVESQGNQSEAARRLGIGRDALRYKMKKHQVLSWISHAKHVGDY